MEFLSFNNLDFNLNFNIDILALILFDINLKIQLLGQTVTSSIRQIKIIQDGSAYFGMQF